MNLPVAALPVLKELITAAAQYQMCKEHERTERIKIEAQLEECLATLNANHEKFFRAMDDNSDMINRAYDAAEKLLADPKVSANPNLLQAVLMFLQNVHAVHSVNFVNAVNANAITRLPRIG